MKTFFNQAKPHLLALVAFLVLALAYNAPQLSGKKLKQDDMLQFTGMARELVDYEKATGHHALWTNALFAGMPAYQIYLPKPGMLVDHLNHFLAYTVPQPAGVLLLMSLCFYFLMVTLGTRPLLAAIGGIAFAFSSYNVIILGVGHITKALAIAYMAPVLAGLIMLFRKQWMAGFATLALGFALELYANHFQITYYLGLIVICYGLYQLVEAVFNKTFKDFFLASGLAILAVGIGIGANYTNLALTFEYQKETMRGESELKALETKGSGSGLDKDYALNWSYGVSETGTFLIPNFHGGASASDAGKKSETYDFLVGKGVDPSMAAEFTSNMPTYFGTQPFTAGPTYFGASVMFFFVFALFFLKGRDRWWVLAACVLSVFLSWGKNFEAFTDIFFNHVPLYNKFRAVAMAQVMAGLLVPFFGFWALTKLMDEVETPQFDAAKATKLLTYVTAGLAGFCLLFALAPGMFFDFTSATVDAQLEKMLPGLRDSVIADRKGMLQGDAWRSFFFIVLSAGTLWALINRKFKPMYAGLLLGALVLADLWAVDKRYLNDKDFISKRQVEQPFEATAADLQIKQDPTPYYRVLDLSGDPFNENRAANFHYSVGGYHPAKLSRYEDIKVRYLSQMNPSVMAMLNTRWVITKGQDGTPQAQRNLAACGNAWFVPQVLPVENAKAEIDSLNGLDPRTMAVVDKRFTNEIKRLESRFDPTSTINLTHYSPDTLKYASKANATQLAVFSEMYYENGWEALIDGKPAPYIRANYALRAMVIPAGEHQIEFRFAPKSYYDGEKVSLASSILLFLAVGGALFMQFKRKKS